jgi:Ca2+ transporting ATPase
MAATTNEEQAFDVKIGKIKEVMECKTGPEALEKLNENFHSLEELARKLACNLQAGIKGDADDIARRVRAFGKNEIPPKPSKSIFRLAFEALQDTTLILLMICAVVSIGLSFYHPSSEIEEDVRDTTTDIGNLEWIEGVAIAIAVIVVVSVSSFNDWRKEKKFRGLQDRIAQDNKCSVVRNAQIIEVNVKELVVGDVCCIKYGDLIQADGIVIQSSDLKIDESALTGETDLIKKNKEQNVNIFSGTHVMEGSGQFLVLAVGLNSQSGIIMSLLGATQEDNDKEEEETGAKAPPAKKKKEKKHKSVLQVKLSKLALQIGYLGWRFLFLFCSTKSF